MQWDGHGKVVTQGQREIDSMVRVSICYPVRLYFLYVSSTAHVYLINPLSYLFCHFVFNQVRA